MKKVVLLERFIQHTSKTESKVTKKQKQQQGKEFERTPSAKSIKAARPKSSQRGDDDHQQELSGFSLKKKSNSKTSLSSASTNKSSKQKYLNVCEK